MTSDSSSSHHLISFAPSGDDREHVLRPTRLGLLAGGGDFPVRFAESARAAGHSIFGLGVAGMVSDSLADACDDFRVVALTRLGKTIRLFKRAGVERVVMAGKIEKSVVFHPVRWIRHLPDWRAMRMWFRSTRTSGEKDSLLLAILQEFSRDDLPIDSALTYCPELLVKHGFLTRKRPSHQQWKDIQFGWELAREMSRLNVGHTVVVRDAAVIAVEAMEGTDKCIRRAGDLCRRGGFTIVKAAKPEQDMRFEAPAVGIETIKTMHESGGRVLAIEAGMTVLLQPGEVTRLADKFGISIVAVNTEELALRSAA